MAGKSDNILPFNDKAVKAAKYEDGESRPIATVPGLCLRLKPSGSAAFVYRYKSGGKTKRITIGDRRVWTLDKAKTRALELALQVDQGIDPGLKVVKPAGMTLRQLFDDRVARNDKAAKRKLAPRTLQNQKYIFERDVFAVFGDRIANEITTDEVAAHLRRVQERTAHSADMVQKALGSLFTWARAQRLITSPNPCSGLEFLVDSAPRKRKISDDELRKLWNGLLYEGRPHPRTRIALQLALLTGQRIGEICGARVDELSLKAAVPVWTISATASVGGKEVDGRMKNRSEQIVILSTQAVAAFQAALHINEGSRYVFPRIAHGVRQPKTQTICPVQTTSVRKQIVDRHGIVDLTTHDFRKFIATWLGDQPHVRPDVIDRILNHALEGVTATHYNQASMTNMLRDAWQMWADHIEEVVSARTSP
jgi:integrase